MNTITVEGTPLIDPKLANGELPKSNFMASYTHPSTKENRLVYLSEAEYRELRLAVDHGNDRDAERILAAHPPEAGQNSTKQFNQLPSKNRQTE